MLLTWGVFLADRKFSLKVIIKSPPFYAIIVAVFLLYYDLELPGFIENTTFINVCNNIPYFDVPWYCLTRLKVFSLNKAIFSSIGRVIIGPIIDIFLFIF